MEEASRRRHREEGIRQEASLGRHRGGGIMEEASGRKASDRRHQGGQALSGRHLGGEIMEQASLSLSFCLSLSRSLSLQ